MTVVVAQRINANDDQVGVVCWHVSDGAEIAAGADLVDLETSKAVVTVEAQSGGRVRHIAKLGDVVRVGSPICEILGAGQDPEPPLEPVAAPSAPPPPATPSGPSPPAPSRPAAPSQPAPGRAASFGTTRFSQAAGQLLASAGETQDGFDGAGLVTVGAVRARLGLAPPRVSQPVAPPDIAQGTPVPAEGLRREALPLSKRAEATALRTGEAGLINSTVVMVFESAAIRERLSRENRFEGSPLPVILYEVSRLLRQWPRFTAFYADDAVVHYDRIDIGLAMDLGRGLKVVTFRDADRLMPIEFHERTAEFGLKYLDNKLRPDELTGSTFTVSDLSSVDVLHFKPLINGHQSVILGIGGDSEQLGHPMSFSLTFDHRVLSGRDAGLFLKELRQRVLSYAPDAPPRSVLRPEGPEPSTASGPIRCDRCGIDNVTYHRQNGDAHMAASFGPDGKLVAVCHVCARGF